MSTPSLTKALPLPHGTPSNLLVSCPLCCVCICPPLFTAHPNTKPTPPLKKEFIPSLHKKPSHSLEVCPWGTVLCLPPRSTHSLMETPHPIPCPLLEAERWRIPILLKAPLLFFLPCLYHLPLPNTPAVAKALCLPLAVFRDLHSTTPFPHTFNGTRDSILNLRCPLPQPWPPPLSSLPASFSPACSYIPSPPCSLTPNASLQCPMPGSGDPTVIGTPLRQSLSYKVPRPS